MTRSIWSRDSERPFDRLGRYEPAIRESLSDVGQAALIITSMALVVGFMVTTVSELPSQGVQGVLLATTIVVALIADFLLLPALIVTLEPFGPEAPGLTA